MFRVFIFLVFFVLGLALETESENLFITNNGVKEPVLTASKGEKELIGSVSDLVKDPFNVFGSNSNFGEDTLQTETDQKPSIGNNDEQQSSEMGVESLPSPREITDSPSTRIDVFGTGIGDSNDLLRKQASSSGLTNQNENMEQPLPTLSLSNSDDFRDDDEMAGEDEEEADWYHNPDNVPDSNDNNDDDGDENSHPVDGSDRGNNFASKQDVNGNEDEEEDIFDRFESRQKDLGAGKVDDFDLYKVAKENLRDRNRDNDDSHNEYNVDDSSLFGDRGKEQGDEEDFLLKKGKQPTAPSNMVLFYTWMIVAILVIVVGVSTYQARCKGLLSKSGRQMTRGEDRKRLLDNEFV